MRRLLVVLAIVVGLFVVVVIGLTQANQNNGPAAKVSNFDLPAAKRKLAAAPGPLHGLYAQANQLLGGGKPAFDRRLAALRGYPVVVNKWASWCVPCQSEFPVFQSVATKKGTKVAFVGVNGKDVDAAARRFLAKRPLPFPSYTDPDEVIARSLRIPQNYPMTVLLDRRGKMAYIHAGPYRDDAALQKDIKRYLGV
jgi:cytochrome c biogenesis protein CcmG, thiol:disulfide interchange protein DsbE